MGKRTCTPLLSCLTALVALSYVQAQDRRFEQCKRRGWVFLPGVQQRSWQAIMHCNALPEPWLACETNPLCIGFTSNGNTGSGWMYRLPRVKECKPDLRVESLELEWPWRWVPMACQDQGPCCGTYVANDAGKGSAYNLECSDSAEAGAPFSPFRDCTQKCPALYNTHQYATIQHWQRECDQQRQMAGLDQRRRALLQLKKQCKCPVAVRKVKNARAQQDNQGYVAPPESSACSAVTRTCNSGTQ